MFEQTSSLDLSVLEPSKSLVQRENTGKEFSIENKKWKYRGEGNANLVLALVGEKKVIRLRKTKTYKECILQEKLFCQFVMLRLLGESFVNVPEIVSLPQSELYELNKTLLSFRPTYRLNNSLFNEYVAIYTDGCFLLNSVPCIPTFCVEVKPKQGWIPHADRILTKCIFCLNQYKKFKEGSVKEISSYCPLNLFSGDLERMRSAVKALINSPQNNFKIFKDGDLVFAEDVTDSLESILEEWFGFSGLEKLVDNLASLVVNALRTEFSDSNRWESFEETLASFHQVERISQKRRKIKLTTLSQQDIDLAQSLLSGTLPCYDESESLPENCVLSRVLKVQKLDVIGAYETYNLYKSLGKNSKCFESYSSIQRIFTPINSYCISTSAKDCSILMAFQKLPSLENNGNGCSVIDSYNNRYILRINVSDLDPKPVSCIDKHRQRDKYAIKCCIHVLQKVNSNSSNNNDTASI